VKTTSDFFLNSFLPESAPDSRLQAVLQLAASCDYEAGHSHQVTRLALRLFDELQALHGLGAEERFWLECGALLHDIGWSEGPRAHHKTSLRIILDAPQLPFDRRERLIIGSIARYHRKALPDEKHDHYAALEPAQRRVVAILAALLRVADGLDRSHQSLVQDLSCEVSSPQIVVRCAVRQPAEDERLEALDKGRLLEQIFDRRLVIEWRL
jgi:exopolyphosphatase/pppGpp-phosphohydrolase